MDLVLTGDMMDAEEARTRGLVGGYTSTGSSDVVSNLLFVLS